MRIIRYLTLVSSCEGRKSTGREMRRGCFGSEGSGVSAGFASFLPTQFLPVASDSCPWPPAACAAGLASEVSLGGADGPPPGPSPWLLAHCFLLGDQCACLLPRPPAVGPSSLLTETFLETSPQSGPHLAVTLAICLPRVLSANRDRHAVKTEGACERLEEIQVGKGCAQAVERVLSAQGAGEEPPGCCTAGQVSTVPTWLRARRLLNLCRSSW